MLQEDKYRTTEIEETTKTGNPRKPQGKEGEEMLERMNKSHFAVMTWAVDLFEFSPKDQVLDIGCGGGATLKYMSEKLSDGHLDGIDYSETSVKKSRELNETDIQSGKMEVVEASVEQLPFEENTFDKITTVESFYFWPDPEENLKEVYRVLKSGGVFFLIADIYGKDDLKEEDLENIKKYNLFNPTIEQFQQMFAAAGFEETVMHTKEGKDWICVEGRKK